MTIVDVPRKDIVWLVRAMAVYNQMDADMIERLVDALTGFDRQYCAAYNRGLMAVPIKIVKQFRFNEKHAREWRDNVGLAYKVLGKLRERFGGDLVKAIAAYVSSIEEVEKAVEQSHFPQYWRDKLPLSTREILSIVEVSGVAS